MLKICNGFSKDDNLVILFIEISFNPFDLKINRSSVTRCFVNLASDQGIIWPMLSFFIFSLK